MECNYKHKNPSTSRSFNSSNLYLMLLQTFVSINRAALIHLFASISYIYMLSSHSRLLLPTRFFCTNESQELKDELLTSLQGCFHSAEGYFKTARSQMLVIFAACSFHMITLLHLLSLLLFLCLALLRLCTMIFLPC